ncbi:MAG: hypothetical protein K0S40_1077 [Actinomycetospora sp.]|jgi:hypothetical protein|nr:hypothetical protein [Actinomycetospora sp.]
MTDLGAVLASIPRRVSTISAEIPRRLPRLIGVASSSTSSDTASRPSVSRVADSRVVVSMSPDLSAGTSS